MAAAPSTNLEVAATQMSGPMCVSREQLYEEIWKAPGTHLAQKYGVSDVVIAKACIVTMFLALHLGFGRCSDMDTKSNARLCRRFLTRGWQ